MASVLATISDTLSIAVASLVLLRSQLILLNISFKWANETKKAPLKLVAYGSNSI